MNFFDSLNNREISTIVWSVIALLFFFSKQEVRSAFGKVIKAFFSKIIFVSFLGMTIYIILIIFILNELHFWDTTVIKDTIIWYIGTAFVLFSSSNKAIRDKEFLKSVILDSIRFVVVYEFIINLYSFSLPVELIIVPLVLFIAILNGYTSTTPKNKQVKDFSASLLTIFGVFLLIYSFYEIVIDFNNFASLKNLRDFLLPIILTIAVLPYIYLIAVYSLYEIIFNRIDRFTQEATVRRYAKWKMWLSFHVQLNKLIALSKTAGSLEFQNQEEVVRFLDRYKKTQVFSPKYEQ